MRLSVCLLLAMMVVMATAADDTNAELTMDERDGHQDKPEAEGSSLPNISPDLHQRLLNLDSFIQNLMTCETRPVVGLTVSVVKDGQTIFAKGYGQRDLQTGQAVDNRTLFGVGSISKSFTSALIADVLGEREDVSWDTALTDILGPSFRFRDEFRTKQATLRDLLVHKMALENYGLVVIDAGQDIDRAELARRIRYFRETFPFRSHWHYNNIMYTLAAHVAEKLTGTSYETLLRERLLKPLGMDDSTIYLTDSPSLAQTYETHNQSGPFVPISPETRRPLKLHLPAGGVVSNALDMARYMNFHLSGGRDMDGREVVPEDALWKTHEADFIMHSYSDDEEPDWPLDPDVMTGCGMGWMISYYKEYKRLHHVGIVTGFTSLLSLYPEVSGGVFTSVNGVRGNFRDIHNVVHYLVADILTGKDHWLNTTTVCTYPEPWWTRPEEEEPMVPETSDDFPRDKRDYEGVYGNHFVGNLSISLNESDGKLYFSIGLIGRGTIVPTKQVNLLKVCFEGPLAGKTPLLAEVEVRDGRVYSLSFSDEIWDPSILFERGLKLSDPIPHTRNGTNVSMKLVIAGLLLVFICGFQTSFSFLRMAMVPFAIILWYSIFVDLDSFQ